MEPVKVAILGASGSVGRTALEVLEEAGEGRFELTGLAAHRSWESLVGAVVRFEPELVGLVDPEAARKLRDAVAGRARTKVLSGPEGILEIVTESGADVILGAITGAAGLPAAVEALRAGRTLALANKESMVMAGGLMRRLVAEYGGRIVPVDSEHSAIYQALRGERRSSVRRLYLTASGGPFRGRSREELAGVTPEEALRHPTWEMGPKITIDSATLMNKGLEVLEARWLFDIEADRIRVLVHPQSIVHSMVEFCDGSIMAQVGVPSMKVPVLVALSDPERFESSYEMFDLASFSTLTFELPDERVFPCLGLGYEAARLGGTAGAVLNAANEAAVNLYLDRRISFLSIADLVRDVLERHRVREASELSEILAADRWAREQVFRRVEQWA